MKNKHYITVFLSTVSWIGTLILYPSLPERIPVHYNYRWEIDGYGPKYTALLLGLLPLFLLGLLKVIPKMDPKRMQMSDHGMEVSL